MKKGQIYEGIVEKVSFPNKGIIYTEEGSIIVKNTVPGQKISCQINKIKNKQAEGRLLQVLERSVDEIESNCPHFGECGGCIFQNLPYEKQLQLKSRQVKELLPPEAVRVFEGIKASPRPFEYRNKMEFSFGDEWIGGPLNLGMHKRGSFYDIVNVFECKIADEDFRIILHTVLQYCRERQFSYYHKIKHIGYLRHLLVRKAARTGEILVGLVTTMQEEHDLHDLAEILMQTSQERLRGNLVGILHLQNDSLADVVKSDKAVVLSGRDYFYENLLGLRFRISPFSFFQTNSLGAEVLYETVREYIGDLTEQGKIELKFNEKIIFDLYSGTGTIAQMLAPVAKKVVGVEIIGEAVEAARENASGNGLSNCEFVAGDVLSVLDELEDKPDFIVLDPPRDGIHQNALQKIIRYGVERLIYISCKPTSLVRDLEVLNRYDYLPERICCVDMFPWTGNVETVCLLRKIKT